MALQGDLASFALPDVLRLLAGTTKTGRLVVEGDGASGQLWLDGGDLVGGVASASPHADGSVDVVFEILRMGGGTFSFVDGESADEAEPRTDVTSAIARAESLVEQWAAIEVVVPSVHSWVSLAEELEGAEVTVSADQWRLLAALAGGSTVRSLGDHFEVTDLIASSRVKDLVEAGLVEVGEPSWSAGAPSGSGQPDERAEPTVRSAHDELAHLSAEGGPVVLESRDDALLPEPLPGEGTTFAGEVDGLGAVDGPSYDAPAESGEPLAPFAVTGFAGEAPASDADRFDPAAFATDGFTVGGFATEAPAPEAEAEFSAEPEDSEAADDDRGSLLKFLSSVKP